MYTIELSILSIAAASLTLGLVYRWGEVLPAGLPLVGGRRLPVVPVVGLAVAGALGVLAVVALSIAHWSSVSGFAGRATSPWALLMVCCYAPAVLWAPLLLAVTVAYARRRRRPQSRWSRRPSVTTGPAGRPPASSG